MAEAHEHHWGTVVADGVWAETAWQVRGCDCGAVTVRPKMPSDQASFWEVDPRGNFRAVQPIVVGPIGPASDSFDTSKLSETEASEVGGTWSATGDADDFTVSPS